MLFRQQCCLDAFVVSYVLLLQFHTPQGPLNNDHKYLNVCCVKGLTMKTLRKQYNNNINTLLLTLCFLLCALQLIHLGNQ